MPKLRHQTLVELFRDKPSLSLDLMRYLGQPALSRRGARSHYLQARYSLGTPNARGGAGDPLCSAGARPKRLAHPKVGRLEGRLEATRQSIREALKARKLPITATAEKRIAQETNLRTLHHWHSRAITVEKTSAIFEE